MPLYTTAPTKEPKTETEKQQTQTLYFLTMRIGIREISQKNYEEVFYRVAMLEKVFGAFLYEVTPEKPRARYYTLQDVKDNIGLKTNASEITRARFEKSIIEQLRREIKNDQDRKY